MIYLHILLSLVLYQILVKVKYEIENYLRFRDQDLVKPFEIQARNLLDHPRHLIFIDQCSILANKDLTIWDHTKWDYNM